jgi:serine/threonine protein kinase
MPEQLPPGAEVAGYRVERLVARGGMGELYEARQLSLDRRVALKLIAPQYASDARFRERFRREARAAAAIDHPHVLPVYEAGETADGQLFLASRFVDGGDLDAHLDRTGPLDVRETIALLTQVAAALDAAHAAGLVHRDVKPANVVLESANGEARAYLGDFGLAKWAAETQITESGALLGTVDYMAPEQIEGGTIDRRADVYAFGGLLHRCLTGQVPYPRDTKSATLMAHMNAPIPMPSTIVPTVPAVLDTAVQRALEKDPAHRAESAGALMRWVAAQVETVPGDAPVPLPWAPDPEPPRPTFTWRRVLAHGAAYSVVWTVAFLAGRGI